MTPAQYNRARSILAQAGSDSARKSHPKHNRDEVPDYQGRALLNEAKDDFMRMDAGQPGLVNGMTAAHNASGQQAADEMGLDW